MHYLDHAATSAVLPEAIDAATRAMREAFGNPSSQHRMGLEAAAIVKESRAAVARALGAPAHEVHFTAGGTESTNIALFGACRKLRRRGGHIITTAIEHAATRNTVRQLESEGFAVTVLTPDGAGRIAPGAVEEALREDTILLSMMLVNNEVGSLLPVGQAGRALKARCPNALFHIDAVQGLFRVPLTPEKWRCDLMSVSGHKIGAPKGVGALYVRKGTRLPPLLFGGGQEDGLRPGTEPVPQIAAFGAACAARQAGFAADVAHVEALCAYLKAQLAEKLPFAVQNGENDVPHVVNFSFPGCKSEVLLRLLESEGVYVSAGSACAKGRESPVLKALGLDKSRVDSALRISFAPTNTREDVDALIAAAMAGAARLRGQGRGR